MPRGHVVYAQLFHGVIYQALPFYVAVALYARIGGKALLIASVVIVHHVMAKLGTQVDGIKGATQVLTHTASVDERIVTALARAVHRPCGEPDNFVASFG
jgi:hypothetical protein